MVSEEVTHLDCKPITERIIERRQGDPLAEARIRTLVFVRRRLERR